MKRLPVVVFLFIMATAICSCISSYHETERRIEQDVNNALKKTIAQMSQDVICADTIRCYHNHLTIPELKDTACLAMRSVRKDKKQETVMVAEANCTPLTVFMLSDQRASATLLFCGMVWIMGSMWYLRRYRPELFVEGLSYGGLVYADNRFLTTKGEQIHLTPMQHSLLEMFITTESHTLSKQEICDRLWPKKPDANDTLYTLIRRIKPIIEANSSLKIEADRGRSYQLIHK